MGGSSEYSYEYDDLYRLTEAKGHYTGPNEQHRYTLQMRYNSVGSILEKTQLHQRTSSGTSWQEQKKTTYQQAYVYSQEQPHAAIHIGNQTYSYDSNGNQTGWTDDKSGQRRKIYWDEENRIRAIQDNGAYYHYVYDAQGERVLKGHSSGQNLYVNASQKAGSGNMSNYTVYVNPYLVLRSGGYTKHYYVESQRMVSKLGSGWDDSGKGPLETTKAGEGKVNYENKQGQLSDAIVKNLKFLGQDGAILTAGKSGKVPPGQLNTKGGSGGGSEPSTSTVESFQYYFHPDHLGSTSYITDASGEVYQHLEYFAFGETFVEEHSNTNRTPFLFNSKELDDETGLYYYGARYYDARTSLWASVDPKADKYSDWSPYNFNFNNPIVLTDPDGKEPIRPLAAPVSVFMDVFNNTPSQMGRSRGADAGRAMARLGSTEWNWSQFRPLPTTTPYFNNRRGRYIYTEKGGWIDMTHFLFYAGKAYNNEQEKINAQRSANSPGFKFLPPESQAQVLKTAAMSPEGEALQSGYLQERFDPTHSSYSYEDLPSDRFGADFGANYFDPNSKLTLGEQLQNYLINVLGATDPEKAPNFNSMPREGSKNAPSRINKTATPVYTSDNP